MLGVAFASDLLLASLALCFCAAFFAALLTVGGQCGVKPHRCTGSRTAGPPVLLSVRINWGHLCRCRERLRAALLCLRFVNYRRRSDIMPRRAVPN